MDAQSVDHILKNVVLGRHFDIKSSGKEKDKIKNIKEMDKYIEKFLKDDNEAPKEKTIPHIEILNKELRKIVLGNIQKP